MYYTTKKGSSNWCASRIDGAFANKVDVLIEMYLTGASVQRVEDITDALWGSKVSPSTISELDFHFLTSANGYLLFIIFSPAVGLDFSASPISPQSFSATSFRPLTASSNSISDAYR